MAVMDEFKEEREALKHGTPKEKWNYFWDYYKWYVIGTVAAVLLIGSFVYQLVTRKEIVFNAVMLNATQLTQEDTYADSFAEYLEINPLKEDVMFDTSIRVMDDSMDETSYTSVMKLTAYTAAADLDVMVTDEHSFQKYGNSETFFDLRTILKEEQLKQYEPYFYYVDQKIIDTINEASSNLEDIPDIDYPDPTKPEDMETPIPVGIYLDNNKELQDNFYFRGENGAAEHVLMGIYVNTEHLDNALRFLAYAFVE